MKGRILVVDDASIMRLMIKDILVYHGYEVVGEAANGREALERYKELQPDLVTMDIIMPEVDGIQGLKDILDYDKSARIVIISAIDQRKALMEAIKSGATDYIIKPFEDDRVLSAIRKSLEEK